MSTKVNTPKSLLGVVMVALLVIGSWATTTVPRLSSTKLAPSAVTAMAPRPAFFVDPTTVFELDGNILDGASDDWEEVNCDGGGSSIASTGVIVDGVGLSVFTTGGSKDINDISQWRWKDGPVPNKDEILNAYAAKYATNILLFGAERIETSGSAFVGVWFFKNTIGLNANGTFSGLHSEGDVLVLSEFSNGGTIASSKVFQWVTSGGDEGTHLLNITGTAPPGSVFSIANAVEIPAPPCWTYTPAGGSGNNPIPANAFFEGGIDIEAFPLLAGSCFSSFAIETRSSFETNSQLKDFVLRDFNTCATCAITGPDPICTGTNVDYTSTGDNIATHEWTFLDNSAGASFVGSQTDATVTVNPGTTGGSFTLNDHITGVGGGSSDCQKTVEVNQTPGAPTTTGSARCGPGVVLLSANDCAGTLKWYAAASGGTAVHEGATFSPDLATTTTFYVSCTVEDCEGPRAPVTGVINAIPAAPSTTGDARCGPGVVNLSADGCDGTLKWYAAASGGAPVHEGATFSPDLAATTSFYVSCTNAANCEGPRAEVTGTINDNPTVTIATDSSCSTSISLTATGHGGSGSGYTFHWTRPDGTTFDGNPLTNVIAPGNYSVTVSDDSECTGTTCSIVGLCLNGACANGASATPQPARRRSRR